jgi:hypothetical protein
VEGVARTLGAGFDVVRAHVHFERDGVVLLLDVLAA